MSYPPVGHPMPTKSPPGPGLSAIIPRIEKRTDKMDGRLERMEGAMDEPVHVRRDLEKLGAFFKRLAREFRRQPGTALSP